VAVADEADHISCYDLICAELATSKATDTLVTGAGQVQWRRRREGTILFRLAAGRGDERERNVTFRNFFFPQFQGG